MSFNTAYAAHYFCFTRWNSSFIISYTQAPKLWESNPESSDLRSDAVTIELPGLRWQREGYDVHWFVRATYVLLIFSLDMFTC